MAYIGWAGFIFEGYRGFAEFRAEQRWFDALLFTNVDGNDNAAGRARSGYDRRFGGKFICRHKFTECPDRILPTRV